MPSKKPRVALTLHPETHAMLEQLAEECGVPVAGIISRVLSGQMMELAEYLEWLEKQKEGTRKRMFGENLMVSYGPESLLEGIRRLDPNYKFVHEQFKDEGRKGKVER